MTKGLGRTLGITVVYPTGKLAITWGALKNSK